MRYDNQPNNGIAYCGHCVDETLVVQSRPAPETETPPCKSCGYPENHVLHFSAHQAFHHFEPATPSAPSPSDVEQATSKAFDAGWEACNERCQGCRCEQCQEMERNQFLAVTLAQEQQK